MKKRKKNIVKEISSEIELSDNSKLQKIKDFIISTLQYSIGIAVIMSLFTGFKYPWKWIDQLYETKNERIEKIDNDWKSAYLDLINWCESETIEQNNLNKKNFKEYIVSASGDFRKCLTDNIFRIDLINNPKFLIKKNEVLQKNFNNIPDELKSFKIDIDEDKKYKKEVHFITSNYFFLRDDDLKSLSNIKMDDDLFMERQILCSYTNKEYEYEWSIRCSRYNLDEQGIGDLRKMFFLGFLSHEQFYLFSRGCYLGCFAEITYLEDGSENYVRGINLISPKQYTWPKFENKDDIKIKNYESIIYQLQFDIKNLKKENPIPDWLKHIDDGLGLKT